MTQKNNNSKYFAVIDLGSNALRADVYYCNYPESNKILLVNKFRALPRLGELVNNSISSEKINEVLKIFQKISSYLNNLDNLSVFAFGTAVFREADNAYEISEILSKELGIQFSIIEGKDEAELIKIGVRAFEKNLQKNDILLDIGGRSTEIIHDISLSIQIGAQNSAFEDIENLGKLQNDLKCIIKKNCPNYLKLKHNESRIVLTSGTGRSLKHLYEKHYNLIYSNNLNEIPLEFIQKIFQSLLNSKDSIQKVLGKEAHRHDLILGGINILLSLCEIFKINRIYPSMFSARHGALINLLLKNYPEIKLNEINLTELKLPSTSK